MPAIHTQHYRYQSTNDKLNCVINIQQLITPLGNNILQRNLVIASAIYWCASVQNFVRIHSDMTFLLSNAYGLLDLLFWVYFFRKTIGQHKISNSLALMKLIYRTTLVCAGKNGTVLVIKCIKMVLYKPPDDA